MKSQHMILDHACRAAGNLYDLNGATLSVSNFDEVNALWGNDFTDWISACLDYFGCWNQKKFNADYLQALEKEIKNRLLQDAHFKPNQSKNSQIKKSYQFINKFADAHAIIQATGFSTQNEASYLAIIDFYNTYRSADKIHEVKRIFYSLAEPFLPLYLEYLFIAEHEKNTALKVFRTLMPMFITAGVIIGACFLLSCITIPEIAFFLILIPVVYISLYAASLYVSITNWLFHDSTSTKVNQRLLAACQGNQKKADSLQFFYMKAIKICDDLDAEFNKNYLNLESKDLRLREENRKKREYLQAEWNNIQYNIEEIGVDDIREIALSRVQQEGREATEQFVETQVKTWIDKVKHHLESNDEYRISHSTSLRSKFFTHEKVADIIQTEALLESRNVS